MVEEEAACAVSYVAEEQSYLNLPRVESTHLVVTLQTSVHDSSITLLCNALFDNLGIDPIRETPHVWSNLSKLDFTRSVVSNGLFEIFVEIAIIEEHIGVVVPPVEVSLDRLDGLQHTIQLLVSRQYHKSSIGSRFAGVGLGTALDEHLVVLFADFPFLLVSQGSGRKR